MWEVWKLRVILYAGVIWSLPYYLKKPWEKLLSEIYHIPFYLSMECENLLKKFLILSSTKRSTPSKRGTFDQIMKDSWINLGHNDELKPYVEPLSDYKDPPELMVSIGYTQEEIKYSLMGQKFEVMAAHQLLGHKSIELEGCTIALRPQPLPNLTNSSSPFPSHKVQNSLCQPQPVGCQQECWSCHFHL